MSRPRATYDNHFNPPDETSMDAGRVAKWALWHSQSDDPEMCCVVCGSLIPIPLGPEPLWPERRRWGRRLEPATGPCAELESMEYQVYPSVAVSLYRAILDQPSEGPPQVLGIALCQIGIPGEPRSVHRDSQTATTWTGPETVEDLCVPFHVADILGPDINREQGRLVGYTIHMPCWVLLNRVIGKGLLEANLSVLLRTVESHWRANRSHWLTLGIIYGYEEHASGVLPWVKRPPMTPFGGGGGGVDHDWRCLETVTNSAVVPEIRAVIEKAERNQAGNRSRRRGQHVSARVPIEVVMMIVEAIYKDPGYGSGGITDTQHLLAAFAWHLPDWYWQARCHPWLIFEVRDLMRANRVVDWEDLCLGVEGLLCNHHWYYHSGLRNRARIVRWIERIRDGFMSRLDRNGGGEG
ncbi:hypothetical protein BO78DRAFT_20554 [Aspergillus sclerotiicarbonarius CBS 121057]|uniref:Uncharacterized protein n=1 Tax=Aspergillus sclerotiicarbonarius (strain CBS 121057 / IBT 28362) TaxID=1448318 RepID=A0A319DV21_ASPSB|nr:hypothetical protein BO78DRAFT_20554 [Aspergillus sclerotiicarbonarius CBS 121057]